MMDKETVVNAINKMEPAMLQTWQKLVDRVCGPDD